MLRFTNRWNVTPQAVLLLNRNGDWLPLIQLSQLTFSTSILSIGRIHYCIHHKSPIPAHYLHLQCIHSCISFVNTLFVHTAFIRQITISKIITTQNIITLNAIKHITVHFTYNPPQPISKIKALSALHQKHHQQQSNPYKPQHSTPSSIPAGSKLPLFYSNMDSFRLPTLSPAPLPRNSKTRRKHLLSLPRLRLLPDAVDDIKKRQNRQTAVLVMSSSFMWNSCITFDSEPFYGMIKQWLSQMFSLCGACT